MILVWLLVIPVAAGMLAWVLSRWSQAASFCVSLAAMLADAGLLVYMGTRGTWPGSPWLWEIDYPWIASLGVRFHLAVDGLSLVLLALTAFLGLAAIAASWTEIKSRAGAFHLCLLLTLAGIMGVFMAIDLFLFYFFWELMLIPMYFLISLWGGENRVRAAIRFFLFTQAGSLLMLVAILTLYFVHGGRTGIYTFDYTGLLKTPMSGPLAFCVMMGFFVGFAVKLPVVGLHTWVPDTYAEAPAAASVLLSGLQVKTAAYGLLRFSLPLFPAASAELAPVAMILGVVGILYAAFQAFGQSDTKRLIAYSSISHMGFVLLGIYAGTRLTLQGTVIILLAHGLSSGGLFIAAGILQQRLQTRRMDALGGLWQSMPRLGGVTLVLALASLGLPGLANFVGEFLVLVGTYAVSPSLAAVGALGLVFSSIYSLWLVSQVFQGPARQQDMGPDLGGREGLVLGVIVAGILGLGVYPQPVMNAVRPQVDSLVNSLTNAKGTAVGQEVPEPVSTIVGHLLDAKRDNR